MNLRGKVIPVVDLRLKLAVEESQYTDRTCIVVVDACTAARDHIFIGIIVDYVCEVLNIRSEEIENAPDFGISSINNNFLGLAKVKGTVKILLDIDRILASDVEIADSLVH
jgi:purine-binding chemotaxis protein CheW